MENKFNNQPNSSDLSTSTKNKSSELNLQFSAESKDNQVSPASVLARTENKRNTNRNILTVACLLLLVGLLFLAAFAFNELNDEKKIEAPGKIPHTSSSQSAVV